MGCFESRLNPSWMTWRGFSVAIISEKSKDQKNVCNVILFHRTNHDKLPSLLDVCVCVPLKRKPQAHSGNGIANGNTLLSKPRLNI